MAVLFDMRAYVVVFCDAMAAMFGAEGIYKYDIELSVISQHNMYITTARADGEAPLVVLLEFSHRMFPHVQFSGRGGWKYGFWCGYQGVCSRFGSRSAWFGGVHTLSCLYHVSLEFFVGVRAVFFCMGAFESRP